MTAPAQRATLVLEHASAVDDADTDVVEDPWCVVAYLIYDSGMRRRATLRRCRTRDEAAKSLEDMWGTLTG